MELIAFEFFRIFTMTVALHSSTASLQSPSARHPWRPPPAVVQTTAPAGPSNVREAPACSSLYSEVIVAQGEAVHFKSPNYPRKYPSNQRCGWRYQSADGSNLEISCSEISLGFRDYFDLIDTVSQRYVSYSWTALSNVRLSAPSDRLLVRLRSSYSWLGGARGFSCNVWGKSTDINPTSAPTTIAGTTSTPLASDSTSPITPAASETPSSTTTPDSSITPAAPETSASSTTSASPETPTTSTSAGTSSSCVCGAKPSVRIVGGAQASEGEYPWMASLGTGANFVCGGSLVTQSWIVTAAHCIKSNTMTMTIGLGYFNIFTPSSTSVTRAVRQIVKHPQYNANTLVNDIALLRIDPIDWAASPTIRPVCLPADLGEDFVDATATIVGWGSTQFGGQTSAVLREAQVPVLSYAECRKAYGTAVTTAMLCAGAALGGVDSCQVNRCCTH
ncbi:transmembrane protease serine 9 [Hyalella azteca]|uniref:Transmembrane protease serine 9 n=1 Tax=Hyalella azteca TaxID=294128 RepID=A0A8B7NCV4_HYAAZ|nr:transmembrane protease serine 9 [Hyalella azteca]